MSQRTNEPLTIKRMIECMRAGTWRWDGVRAWHGGPLVSWHPPCQRIPTWRVHWTLWGMPLINPPQVNILAQHAVLVDNSAVCCSTGVVMMPFLLAAFDFLLKVWYSHACLVCSWWWRIWFCLVCCLHAGTNPVSIWHTWTKRFTCITHWRVCEYATFPWPAFLATEQCILTHKTYLFLQSPNKS